MVFLECWLHGMLAPANAKLTYYWGRFAKPPPSRFEFCVFCLRRPAFCFAWIFRLSRISRLTRLSNLSRLPKLSHLTKLSKLSKLSKLTSTTKLFSCACFLEAACLFLFRNRCLSQAPKSIPKRLTASTYPFQSFQRVRNQNGAPDIPSR